MSRKPYIHQQPDNWYTQSTFYKLYMLRELTAVPTALAALNLFWGIAALAGSLESWQHWIAFQKHPLMIVFNLIVIVSSLYNSKTWFEAIPKAMPIQRGTKFVPAGILIKGAWATFGAIFVALAVITVLLA